MFDRIDLKTRFAIGCTVLFLLATWLPLRQALHAHREDVARQIAEEQANDVARVAAGIDHTLKLRIAALEAVASGIRPEWLSRPGEIERYLTLHRNLGDMFRLGLAVVSSEGRVLTDYPPLPGRRGADFSQQRGFVGVMATGRLSFGQAHRSLFTGEPIVAIAVPILDGNRQTRGVIIGAIGLLGDGLLDEPKRPDLSGAQFFLASPDDRVHLTASDPAWVLQPLDEAMAGLVRNRPANSPIGTVLMTLGGRQVLATALPLATTSWVLVGTRATATAFAPTEALEQKILAFAAVFSAFLLTLLWLLSYRLLTPIDRFSQDLDALSQDVSGITPLPEAGPMEVRRLAVNFNRLATVINGQTRQIREEAERFRILADLSPTLIRLTDAIGNTRWVNRSWCAFAGITPEQALAANWADALHPDERQQVVRNLTLHHDARVPVDTEFRLRRHDGSYRWFANRSAPVYDLDGQYVGQVSSCIDITTAKLDAEEQQRLLAENRNLVGSIFRVLEQERQRIARDLHDDLGQWITAIRANTTAVARALPAETTANIRQAVVAIGDCAASLHDTVRKMLQELRPSHMDTLGLGDGLRELVDQWQRAFPAIACELAVDDRIADPPDELRTTLYRIVQESLTNVARHAMASRVSIRLHLDRGLFPDDARLALVVEDDGVGIHAQGKGSSGLGLVGIRERVLALRGEFVIRGRPGRGTTLDIHLPIAPLTTSPGDSNGQFDDRA